MFVLVTLIAIGLAGGVLVAWPPGRSRLISALRSRLRAGWLAGPTATQLGRLGLSAGPAGTVLLILAPWSTDNHATERLLRRMVEGTGVAVRVLDATDHPEVLAPWRVRQAPTLFFVSAAGRTVDRIGGPPDPDAVERALARIEPDRAVA